MMHRSHSLSFALAALALVILIGLLAGCATQTGAGSDQALVSSAEREATAIIESARATALVMAAQSEAQALVAAAGSAATRTPLALVATPGSAADLPVAQIMITATPPFEPVGEGTPIPTQIIAVNFGMDGDMINVQFYCDPFFTQYLFPNYIKVTNEATGKVYNEVPVLPVIGPLIGKPVTAGQPGYVMLVNSEPRLQPGDLVTVEIFDFKQEHVIVTK